MKKCVKAIAQMDNSDGTFESANRIYDKRYCCPTIPTCGGGGIQPKVIKKWRGYNVENGKNISGGGYYSGTSKDFDRGVLDGMSRTIKANQHDACVVCKTNIKPFAMRGRKKLAPKRIKYGKEIRKQYESHEINEKRSSIQQLEPRNDGLCNAITTVGKDYLYIAEVNMETQEPLRDENGKCVEDYLVDGYGVFKLTARECGRLQGVSDKDIDKMLSVNSKSQCYKQFGNSICVPVLMAIFSQLGISGVKKWNDMTEEERYNLIDKNR